MPASDYSDIEQLSESLLEASNTMSEMVKLVAKARQVREYDGDRRKRALSLAVRDAMHSAPNLSATAAEHIGRASEGYGDALNSLRNELHEAESAIATWEAAKVRFEAIRSLLSIQKQIVTNL